MKVKRTCGNCGTVWHARIGFSGSYILKVIFYSLLVGFTRGSIIDMRYMETQDEKRDKTCPSCNYTVYSQEKVVKQKTAHKQYRRLKKMKKAEPVIEKQENLNKTTLFLLSFFLGCFGADRFYADKMATGVLKLLTFGGFGIWWLIDLILIANGKFTNTSK